MSERSVVHELPPLDPMVQRQLEALFERWQNHNAVKGSNSVRLGDYEELDVQTARDMAAQDKAVDKLTHEAEPLFELIESDNEVLKIYKKENDVLNPALATAKTLLLLAKRHGANELNERDIDALLTALEVVGTGPLPSSLVPDGYVEDLNFNDIRAQDVLEPLWELDLLLEQAEGETIELPADFFFECIGSLKEILDSLELLEKAKTWEADRKDHLELCRLFVQHKKTIAERIMALLTSTSDPNFVDKLIEAENDRLDDIIFEAESEANG